MNGEDRSSTASDPARAARRATALRENLHKRKARSRATEDGPSDTTKE